MLDLLWLIPALPFAGFLALILTGPHVPRRITALIGAGSVGMSAVCAIAAAMAFIASPPEVHVVTRTLWRWMEVGGFIPSVTLSLDALSVVMVLVITIVGFLIHLYSTEFMQDDEGYSRFFAYLNLFVGSMLLLVMAGDLLLLYLGWEGVGLCSYLLIGFWYRDPANGSAARKAFITTRIGDTAMAVGLFLLFTNLGTLEIAEVQRRAAAEWPVGSGLAVAAAALLLGGAVGKSAQLPLQTWLPDAMAGPTPVSALIHAATMVTAGMYLIARMHVLFSLAPLVQTAVAVIGAATLLIAGFSALTQHDLKRVLAYSTISQIGYLFLALGVGAWSAAIFHFMTHAFFKALLFLGAGAVIMSLRDEHDMLKMGGLWKEMPVTFWTFLIGVASLSALPFVTAGFYSKDLILWDAWASPRGSVWLWGAGVAGAFLTSLYSFRMLFLTFFGDQKTAVGTLPGRCVLVPLVVLAVLSLIGGFVELPPLFGDFRPFSAFLAPVLPPLNEPHDTATELALLLVTEALQFLGIGLAYVLFLKWPALVDGIVRSRVGGAVHRFWFTGWGFDRVYERLFVRPFVWLARVNRDDVIDLLYRGMTKMTVSLHRGLSFTQSGKVRWYAFGIGLGAVMLIGIALIGVHLTRSPLP